MVPYLETKAKIPLTAPKLEYYEISIGTRTEEGSRQLFWLFHLIADIDV
jgi:hypothetical protein